jgi:hypothetical protein
MAGRKFRLKMRALRGNRRAYREPIRSPGREPIFSRHDVLGRRSFVRVHSASAADVFASLSGTIPPHARYLGRSQMLHPNVIVNPLIGMAFET